MAHSDSHSDTATQVVGDSDKMSRGALTMVWFSLCSAVFYLLMGAELATVYGTKNALIGTVLGVVALSGLAYPFSTHAVRSGQSCYLLSRDIFGTTGASLATLIFATIAIYYAVFESSLVAVAATKVIPSVNYKFASMIIVIYSMVLVTGSIQQWLDKLNGMLLPIYLICLALCVVLSIRRYGYSAHWLSIPPSAGAPVGGWWNCFIAVFGMQLLMMITLDMGRFGKIADIRYHTLVAFGLPFYVLTFLLNTLVGIFLAATARLGNVSETVVMDVILTVLGGPLGLFFIWVTQTRINTANYFLASSNMQALLRELVKIRLPRMACVAIAGLFVYVFMTSGNVLKYILVAVNFQAVILTAWVGVALARITSTDQRIAVVSTPPALISRGLIAWTAGAAAGMAMMMRGGFTASLSVPVTLALAYVLYRVLPSRTAAPRVESKAHPGELAP
jgi:purine-cytosine permease-like protein